jgi:hypothetical protein
MSEQRSKLQHDLEGPGVVVGNTRFLLHQGLATATWQWKIASDGVGTERDDTKPDETLSADNVRAVMEANGGEDGIHGEELRIYASGDLMDRLAGIVDNMLRKQRRERLRETLNASGVHLGTLHFRLADFATDTWQTSEDKRLRTHGAGIEDDLTLTTVQGILRARPGVDLDVLVSESLVERTCMVVEELEDAERRPGIYVDDLDLEADGGFTIGTTTFKVTREMDGPVWRFSPNGIVHGQSTLTRDSILQQIEKADGRPLEVLAAPDLAGDLLKVTREVLAEAVRRGWSIIPGRARVLVDGEQIGEATSFAVGEGHGFAGLSSEEAEILQHVLSEIRSEPDGAVITLDAKEKDLHRRFVEAAARGLLPVYLNPEMAGHCIHRDGEGNPKLVFGEMPDVRAARHLASGIDQALRAAEPPMRSVTLDGIVTVDDDGDLCIDDEDVIQALALLDESLVGFDLTGPDTHIELAGGLDLLEGGMGDEPHEDGPGWLKVGSLDLLPILTKLTGEKVVMSVVESMRTATVQAVAEEAPKTAEDDVVGKIRVALAAAKLIQANRHYEETPDGTPDHPGTPSAKNDTAVQRLTEALAWAEQDAAEKR